MSIGLPEERQELARVARAFLGSNGAREESRALLEAPNDRVPSFWKEMAELGWMGLHIDEVYRGQGFGLPGLADGSLVGAIGLGGDLAYDSGGRLHGSPGWVLGAEVAQRKGAIAPRIVGPAAAVREGDERRVGTWLMATMDTSIGEGTSKIIRNQIAKRLLGLPRDPLLR